MVNATITAGGVVLNTKGEVLVVSQHGNSWSLPKGHVESGEDMLTAAVREIKEESGVVELKLVKELGTYERYKIGKDGKGEDGSELKRITLYLFTTEEEDLQPEDPENPEAKWVKKEDVASWLTHPKDQEFFVSIADLF
jgi:ADP-ribose pyrophosphatase YjhB (NUDIX family)